MSILSMKKGLIAALLLLAALLCLLPLALAENSSALADEYAGESGITFTFTDSGITASPANQSGYKISGTALAINEAGTYVLSGSCADGSITVKKGVTDVTLVLNGLTLTSDDTAPLTCNKSSQVTIVAADKTINTLTDAALNNDENYPDNLNAENAVIKCKDGSQVTICGSGVLNINANGKNGLKSGATTEAEGSAWLTIQDLSLNIKASVNDGINAEQLLTINSGNITIDAADKGIHSDYTMNIGELGKNGPTINITNCTEGLEAATLNINSGNITIHAEDDCLNAANSALSGYAFAINIAGGNLLMDTTDGDGIDSNGSLNISGGTIIVWSANRADNQPLDADGLITITGGTVLAAGGSAGMGNSINATQPYVTFGSSSMRGGNMAGSMGGSMNRDMSKPDGQASQTGDRQSRQMQQQTPPELPADARRNAQPAPAEGQTSQSALNINKGDAFSIQDASGQTLYAGNAVCDIAYLFFSSENLADGADYTLKSGDTEAASATAQTGSSSTGGQSWRPDQKPELQPDQQPDKQPAKPE